MERIADEQKVEKWQTIDGMKFDSSSEAEQWENSLSCVALKMIKGKFDYVRTNRDIEKIGYSYNLFEDELSAYLFEPEDEADIRNILMYSETKGYYFAGDGKEVKVGEKYLFLVDNERERCVLVSPRILENKLKRETEALNKIFNAE